MKQYKVKHEIQYHDIIECITCALDARDTYTAGHSKRVSDMDLRVCYVLRLKKKEIQKIHIAAHLHDIGKIGVPDVILLKEGRLEPEEWEQMKKHSEIGAEILSKSHYLGELKDIVLHHHERYDGGGYPAGIQGKQIPLGSRIIAICDSIDAMSSNRCYRKAYDRDFCYQEIKKNLGKMYDSEIGKAVLEHWDYVVGNEKETYKKEGDKWKGK